MSWLNPAALIGLLALAVPIVVHLFGRRVARRQRFPTLRLLADVRPTPATRSRPSDVLLLALRCAVIIAAVLALAQPLWSSPERARAARVPVRAIIVDTSASMLRLTSDGSSALQRARERARGMLDSAREGIVVETDQPGANVAGAASWLAGRSGLRELIIVSDFQWGAIVDGHLAQVVPGIGLTLERIAGSPRSSDSRLLLGDFARIITADAQPNRSIATWTTLPQDTAVSVAVLASAAQTGDVRASVAAVRATTFSPRAASPGVALIFPGYAARPAREPDRPLDSAWQGDLLIALRRDRVLAAAADAAVVPPGCNAGGVVIARNARREPIATMARSPSGAEHEVVVFSCVEPGTLAGTAMLAAMVSALGQVPSLQEAEPMVLPDELLRTWERPPTAVGPQGRVETSPDGRWLWVAAIALLLVEGWVRRRPRGSAAVATTGVPRERVA